MSTLTFAASAAGSGSSLGSVISGFIGALIGGAAAVIAAVVTANKNLERERVRFDTEAKEARTQLLRDRISETFSQAFAIQHEMSWITWYAVDAPHLVDQENADAYHKNVHDDFVNMQAALAAIAGLDLRAYEDIRPTARKLYDLEVKVAKGVSGIFNDEISAISELRGLSEEVRQLEIDLPPKLHEVMLAAERRPTSDATLHSSPT